MKNDPLKFSLSIIFFSLSVICFGQSKLKITCVDKVSLERIPNAKLEISVLDTVFYLKSNNEGQFNWIDVPHHEIVSLFISHPMYESLSYKTKEFNPKQDTLELSLSLKPIKTQVIQEVSVKKPGIPDTVFNSMFYHVADFEIDSLGNYVLLVYPKRTGKENEVLLFDGKEIKVQKELNDMGIKLIRDFRGNIHVISNENVYSIIYNSDSLWYGSIPKEYFLNYIFPIVDSATTKYYFSNYADYYPAFDYFLHDQLDTTYKRLLHIEDALVMELYRSEYKWVDVRTRLWAKQKELQSGIDAEIWVGANYFTQSLYYKSPYAPLFKVKDSLYVFDFHSDRMFVFNLMGDSIRSVPLLFHYHASKTGWKKQILQDHFTQELYAVYEKEGITQLGNIDLINASILFKRRIFHKYVEKVRINQGFVYYVYRPFESIQKRFLYKEKLLD